MFFSFDKVEFSSPGFIYYYYILEKESFSKAVLMRALAPVLLTSIVVLLGPGENICYLVALLLTSIILFDNNY